MTGNKVTGLLAAFAIALGMITMGCVEDEAKDNVLLYQPQGVTNADLVGMVTREITPPPTGLNVIGYIDGATGVYKFHEGFVLDPNQIVEIDESDVMIPDACDEDECTEDGDGHYPLGGEIRRVLGGRVLDGGGINLKGGDGVESEGVDAVSPGVVNWMYIDHDDDGYVFCWGWCDETVCGETCVYE